MDGIFSIQLQCFCLFVPSSSLKVCFRSKAAVLSWACTGFACLTQGSKNYSNKYKTIFKKDFFYLFIWLSQVFVKACGMQFPDQGQNPGPLHRERGLLATGPPVKSLQDHFRWNTYEQMHLLKCRLEVKSFHFFHQFLFKINLLKILKVNLHKQPLDMVKL